jgi:hypothetical protein
MIINKKIVRVKFVDWAGNFEDSVIYKIIKEKYLIEITDSPNFLFFSDYGFEHLNYDCVRIFISGENTVPDFNICDYAVATPHITYNDRYLRLPISFLTFEFEKIYLKNIENVDLYLNRKFCNFVYSNYNQSDPIRIIFFKELSKYKKVDSPGSLMNNHSKIGSSLEDKINFISQYKFTISFENSSFDGYTTEKLIQPMSVNSIPIYWGNPSVESDFNPQSIIILPDDSLQSIRKIIDYIIYLDKNDQEYISKLEQSWLNDGQKKTPLNLINEFLDKILIQEFEFAFRRPKFGYNMTYINRFNSTPVNQKAKDLASILSIKTIVKLLYHKINLISKIYIINKLNSFKNIFK